MRTITLPRTSDPESSTVFRLNDWRDVVEGTWIRTEARTPAHDAAWWTAENGDAVGCGTTLDAIRTALEQGAAAPPQGGEG